MANETPADGHDARPNSESALCKIGNIGQDIKTRMAKNVNLTGDCRHGIMSFPDDDDNPAGVGA